MSDTKEKETQVKQDGSKMKRTIKYKIIKN